MSPVQIENIFTQSILLPPDGNTKFAVDVLRLDVMHEYISGNKYFKLRFHIEAARKENKTLVTFGGAWSNHLLATAAMCKLEGIPAIGIVRGAQPKELSVILNMCTEMGMELEFISREDYRNKTIPGKYHTERFYLVPEGGFSERGMKGAATIRQHFKQDHYTHICCAAGTGTTAAGLLDAGMEKIVAVSVLKNYLEMDSKINSLSGKNNQRLEILHNYSFGGYANHTPELFAFMNKFYSSTGIPTDFVYTAKLFYAINDCLLKNYFPSNSKILIIHSGGLKGNLSLRKGTLIF